MGYLILIPSFKPLHYQGLDGSADSDSGNTKSRWSLIRTHGTTGNRDVEIKNAKTIALSTAESECCAATDTAVQVTYLSCMVMTSQCLSIK